MQSHDHVTRIEPYTWHRCSRVELDGEYLVCVLDGSHRYDLLDNRAQRHIRFLNLKTDEDLVRFVRNWGSLMFSDLSVHDGEVTIREACALYWTFQSKLAAELSLVQSLKPGDKEGLKAALLSYVAANDSWWSITTGRKSSRTAFVLSRLYTGRDRIPEEWIPQANISRLLQIAESCIASFSLEFRASVTWRDRQPQITWAPHVHSLAQAIEWDLWNSFVGKRPLTICEECQTAFQPDSAHPRKFCSYKCAHRVAMRTYRRNNEDETKGTRGKHAKAKKA